jgi:hypothetical protein
MQEKGLRRSILFTNESSANQQAPLLFYRHIGLAHDTNKSPEAHKLLSKLRSCRAVYFRELEPRLAFLNRFLFMQTNDLHPLIRGKFLPNRRAGKVSLPVHEARGWVRKHLWHPKHICSVSPAAIRNVRRI